MTQAPSPRKLTVQEYLDREVEAESKSEYENGDLIDMSGGSIDHSSIISNTLGELYMQLRHGPCRVYDSNLKVRPKAAARIAIPISPSSAGRLSRTPTTRASTRSSTRRC